MWLRPDNAVGALSGNFWVSTTCLYQRHGPVLVRLLLRVFRLEVRRIGPNSIAELQRAAEDVKGMIMEEIL